MRIELPDPELLRTPPTLDTMPAGTVSHSTASGAFQVGRYRLTDGVWQGVELLVVDAGRVRAAICPTRGMSLWKARAGSLDIGWKSPVQGPVHPSFVALTESNGLGWLDGFDELLVRCGLNSFGAPDFDANNQLLHPLHGRIGNTPTRGYEVLVDPAHSLLEVHGHVHETRFMQYNLQLHARYRFAFDQPTIEIHDTVTNGRPVSCGMQLLYHINVGQPFLQSGSRLHTTAPRVVARNAHAAESIDQWNVYAPPTAGFEEQVYFFQGSPLENGWATALLHAPDAGLGFAVHYDTESLPFFTQWKNTVGEADGYVTGLEPGTGLPNPRSFELQQGRVVGLEAGQSRDFRVKLEVLDNRSRVQSLAERIDQQEPAELVDFDAAWCLPR